MKKFNYYEDLPISMGAEDVQAFLNISRADAYQLMHRADFPTIKAGKRMLVLREDFLKWLEMQAGRTEAV